MNKKIAITGGIGSGKTTVVQILNEMGYTTFSCDGLYQEIIRRKSYVLEIEKRFPQAVVNGRIDRAKLAQIIFYDEGKRKELNQIAHPLIMQELLKRNEDLQEDIFEHIESLKKRKIEIEKAKFENYPQQKQ